MCLANGFEDTEFKSVNTGRKIFYYELEAWCTNLCTGGVQPAHPHGGHGRRSSWGGGQLGVGLAGARGRGHSGRSVVRSICIIFFYYIGRGVGNQNNTPVCSYPMQTQM